LRSNERKRDSRRMDKNVSQQKSSIGEISCRRHGIRQILLEEIPSENCTPPTESELRLYALHELGIDLDQEPELRSLALAGLTSPLPPGWQAVQLLLPVDEVGKTADPEPGWVLYYFNSSSGQSTWEHPSNARFRRRVAKQRRRLASAETAAAAGATNAEAELPCRVAQYFRRRGLSIETSTSHNGDDRTIHKEASVKCGYDKRARSQRPSVKPQNLSARCSSSSALPDGAHSSSLCSADLHGQHRQQYAKQQQTPQGRQRRKSVTTTTSSGAVDSVDSGFTSSSDQLEAESGCRSKKQQFGGRNRPLLDWSRVSQRTKVQLPPSGCKLAKKHCC
uniref:WW domain-containing protein n=2 Tax=Macrostomum lignano TaxID=282301 RepID=A0A1I8FYT9_9PLAT